MVPRSYHFPRLITPSEIARRYESLCKTSIDCSNGVVHLGRGGGEGGGVTAGKKDVSDE